MQAELTIPIDTRAPVLQGRKSHTNPSHYESQHQRRHGTEQNTFPPYRGTHHSKPQGDTAATANGWAFSQSPRGGTVQRIVPHPNYQAARHQQHSTPNSFSRGVNVISPNSFPTRNQPPSQPSLYNTGSYRQTSFTAEEVINQASFLEGIFHLVMPNVEINPQEIVEKEKFRVQVEEICRNVITLHEIEVNRNMEFQSSTVQLKCFGSLASGFATKAADMDLGILSPMSRLSPDSPDSPIPRLIEKALLERGFGARLLTRTRVPIIKLCEKPSEQLRLDLLESRARWEKGLTDDDVLDDQDGRDGAAITEAGHLPSDQRRGSHEQKELAGMTYEEQLASLKQSETQFLATYYGNAKRLLRRLKGRDITISNVVDFRHADYKLLDDVSNAFINGLHDKYLKSRIQAYPSFRSTRPPERVNFRSLAGAHMMAEGEKLVITWETQPITEGNSKSKQNAKSAVHDWKTLLQTASFGAEPLAFNRSIHTILEKLRQIPIVQLMQLKQEQYESPTQYHAKAAKIAADLGHANTEVVQKVSQHYVSGIRDKDVRDKVQEFVTNVGVPLSLKIIARKHKALHLVTEYERALEKCLYDEKAVPKIREYMKLLQGVQQLFLPGMDTFDFHVPATPDLIAQIRQLPDPSRLAPNQPRDRYHDNLEFPKNGIGVQCDINFSAHLAMQNTALLRCYAYTDPRVKPLVLFVKHWAKTRGINTPYRGSLSSYGYVLMVLHYLVNIAEPFVCPNLQLLAPPYPESLEGISTCKGRNVCFWRDEQEIQRLASQGQLNQNRYTPGYLLRGFFEYYAQGNMMSTVQKRGFDWGRDVLSLRTLGGLLSKQEKGWTGARIVYQLETGAPPNPAEVGFNGGAQSPEAIAVQPTMPHAHPPQPTSPEAAPISPVAQAAKAPEFKEIRHRYLFAIEDPFELEHNVARTVTHNGIVSIRNEFRRAWRIIQQASRDGQVQENLLDDVKVEAQKAEKMQFDELLQELHGPHIFPGPARD
ncbi:hypothetical protein M426DRAFT_55986 [Hypoxylon sp. CI-4A]|nr:hypothetical protein M426DRAFT_55986 [Hypoxylon sp. CI-4A]